MPASTLHGAAYPIYSGRRPDPFQRRKVGSIRDNPKLLKIRQQFENACRESTKKEVSESAPSSFSMSRRSGTVVLDQLLKTKLSDKSEALPRGELDASPNRRNSEGDIKTRNSLSTVIYENAATITAASLHSPDFKQFDLQVSSSESGVHTNSSASEEDSSPGSLQLFGGNEVDEGANKFFRSPTEPAPPIPRRGMSSSFQNDFGLASPTRKNRPDFDTKNSSSPSSVKNAIQAYEKLSTFDHRSEHGKKSKSGKSVLRRDDSMSGRRSFISRRNSRRNSWRRSRHLTDEISSKAPAKSKEAIPLRDDSGCGLSDGEDRTQGVYQTLNTAVNVQRQLCDPYDRLNRLHDVVNRIHKGQPANCAACKAIPKSFLQYQSSDEASVTQVKCNELAPHHHPPCICFACRHSVFSCVTPSVVEQQSDSTSPEHATVDSDVLYHNICCLNTPNREGWRQSRRRPVCEQNGRVCIVNCDMEKCSSGSLDKNSGTFFAKLHCPADSPEIAPVDSYESDEGWADITDSDDEKNSFSDKRNHSNFIRSHHSNAPSSPVTDTLGKNEAVDVDHLTNKCLNLDLDRTLSTEHLYESISELETLSEEEHSSPGTIPDLPSPGENELDSGEWSTESGSSATCDEGPGKGSSAGQFRFKVNHEGREKKTFMKTVLGKKAGNPKKSRMSNFFVPWLSTQEGATGKSPKGQRKGISKDKRSQSIPAISPKLSLSCRKGISNSSEILDVRNRADGSEDNLLSIPDGPSSISSRESDASSAYLRSDQVQGPEQPKSPGCARVESTVEVAVEKVRKRSASGGSERSYIVFNPVKEEDVPLYQFYERNIKERVSFCRSPPSLSPVMWTGESPSGAEGTPRLTSPQLSVVEQLSPDAQDMKMQWCELSEVKESGILERISAQELKLQEALFELIQSQASYVRSLRVLYENFIRTPEFLSDFECSSCVLSKHEHDVLFSDIVRVKEVSERLLNGVTTRWGDGCLIPDICDIIYEQAVQPEFSVYVRYCSNRVYQERTLKELKETRLIFLEVLRRLESNPVCQGLSLESFLFLPMQHIARLPLLLDNIFRWITPDSPAQGTCSRALEAVHKVFVDCNEGARRMERLEEMFALHKQLEFKECKVIPLISASRWLLKKGELMKLEFDKKTTFGRSNRCCRIPVYLFLFNDVLILTKKKNDECYYVVDYCLREKMQALVVNSKDLQHPMVVPNSCRYLLYLTLFHNHQGTAVDLVLNCSLLSERIRWLEAINNTVMNKPCEVWEYDCPQVQCVRSYIAQQPDELSLQESDVVTIHRKMNDGWYEGRRLRDGLQGWFPASYTMDIPCSRARASNLRQCYRLLMLSQNR